MTLHFDKVSTHPLDDINIVGTTASVTNTTIANTTTVNTTVGI